MARLSYTEPDLLDDALWVFRLLLNFENLFGNDSSWSFRVSRKLMKSRNLMNIILFSQLIQSHFSLNIICFIRSRAHSTTATQKTHTTCKTARSSPWLLKNRPSTRRKPGQLTMSKVSFLFANSKFHTCISMTFSNFISCSARINSITGC